MTNLPAQPQFADYCYRWADHVPVIDAASLTDTEMRAHLRAISRWAAEAVSLGFEAAGRPPARLNLALADAFALAKKEACALTGTETHIFDFDLLPRREWTREGIWRAMKEDWPQARDQLGRFDASQLKAKGQFGKKVSDTVDLYFSNGGVNMSGCAITTAFNEFLPQIRAMRQDPARYLHDISRAHWSLIAITTRPRKGFSSHTNVMKDFYHNADRGPFKPGALRLRILMHELGHARYAHVDGGNILKRIGEEISAESWGLLAASWLTRDRDTWISEATREEMALQLAPGARGTEHRYAQSRAEIASGIDPSAALPVHQALKPLRAAMGWDLLPSTKAMSLKDIRKASENFAEAVTGSKMPDLCSEKMAALYFTQLWQMRPDLIEQGSSRLKQACEWGDRYWVACAQKGESRMEALVQNVRNSAPNPSYPVTPNHRKPGMPTHQI